MTANLNFESLSNDTTRHKEHYSDRLVIGHAVVEVDIMKGLWHIDQ